VAGPQGTQGVAGVQGFQGRQGFQGAQGPQGRQGAIGVPGPQGVQGVTGAQGFQGFQGRQGIQGPQGRQGLFGATGLTGATGATNVAGFQGRQGVQGPRGFQGRQGATVTGPQGAQGVTGVAGFQGRQGAQGPQGRQGIIGATGPQGRQGASGATGPQGFQGRQGSNATTTTNPNVSSLGINTATPPLGVLRATGDIITGYSDFRLKKNITKIDNALEKIKTINGVYYKANEIYKGFGFKNDNRQVGLIAQEVQKIAPEIIKRAPFDIDENGNSKSGKDYMTLDYERLVPVLLEAIKEQQSQINIILKEIEQKNYDR
jgi:hypothetical protein